MNRLVDSLSPYLLQHKSNPVDWYPWGTEAFELARVTDKPIFLSVGYAACHWCHVMEHESFENHVVAQYLNANFVSVKVDREERPDVDQLYMNAVQVMAGHGGWPMSVFLNHQLEPFFAGTYWPVKPRMGSATFPQVLEAISNAWQNRRSEVEHHAEQMAGSLRQIVSEQTSRSKDGLPEQEIVMDAVNRLLGILDQHHGGFGTAPKFPHVTDLQFLLQVGATRDEPTCIDAVENALDGMASGGIRDHLGGGFARYSVDAQWLVPHFEKMLYDNGLLAEVYLQAFQVTNHQRHADVAREILRYLCRDLIDPAGGFHCSEDADSEGIEGKFYVWHPTEVLEVLGQERGTRFCQIYDITDAGNFEGQSIPRLKKPVAHWAKDLGVSHESLQESLAADRELMRLHREQRVRPSKDDKVLVAWNSLAIKALALGGVILDEPEFVAAAETAAAFIFEKMKSGDQRLCHVYRAGESSGTGYLDDYAFTLEACLSLFEASGDLVWIHRADQIAQIMLSHFKDDARGGFFYTADDAEQLITRTKDWHDGSLVSGNASAARGLLKLSCLMGRQDYRDAVESLLIAGSDILREQSRASGALLAAFDRYWSDGEQLVLAVKDKVALSRHRSLYLKCFRPNATLSWVFDLHDESVGSSVIKLNENRSTLDGEPTLYVCLDYVCQQPLLGSELKEWLEQVKDM